MAEDHVQGERRRGAAQSGGGELANERPAGGLEQQGGVTLLVDESDEGGLLEQVAAKTGANRHEAFDGAVPGDRDVADSGRRSARRGRRAAPPCRRRASQIGGRGDAELSREAAHGEPVQPLGLDDLERDADDLVAGKAGLTSTTGHGTMLQEQRYRARPVSQGGSSCQPPRRRRRTGTRWSRPTGTPAPRSTSTATTSSRAYLDEFDRWVADYVVPYPDLEGPNASRNWDSDRRLAELEADGIVAEVLFPNTVPPFYPKTSLTQLPPASGAELGRRWAGLRAHNRWLADFCAAAPGRRAGIAQIILNDVDLAVAEIRWAREAGLTGGVLLPGAPPGTGLEPLYSPVYEPIWAVCEELGMPLNHHSGSAVPPMGEQTVDKVIFLLEVTWWANRTLWHLIVSGALERHPDLQLVFTEQGTAWIPERLATLDYFFERMRGGAGANGSQEMEWGTTVDGPLVAAAQRVLGPPVPRRVELHATVRSAAPLRGRCRQDHVGMRLPAPGDQLPVRGRRCASRTPTSTRPRCGRWSATTRRRCMASTSIGWRRSRHGSDQPSPRSPGRSCPTTSRTIRAAARRSPRHQRRRHHRSQPRPDPGRVTTTRTPATDRQDKGTRSWGPSGTAHDPKPSFGIASSRRHRPGRGRRRWSRSTRPTPT